MQNRTINFALVVAGCAALSIPMPGVAQDSPVSGLAECAAVADDAQRLACFDALAGRPDPPPADVPPPPAATAAPEPAATAAPEPASVPVGPSPITDEVGRERIERSGEGERPVYSATVTRCEENRQSGQTYFFLENGQVWRQATYRRLRFRDCRFEVTLSEDGFGYAMFIPSEDRRIRVTRIR